MLVVARERLAVDGVKVLSRVQEPEPDLRDRRPGALAVGLAEVRDPRASAPARAVETARAALGRRIGRPPHAFAHVHLVASVEPAPPDPDVLAVAGEVEQPVARRDLDLVLRPGAGLADRWSLGNERCRQGEDD